MGNASTKLDVFRGFIARDSLQRELADFLLGDLDPLFGNDDSHDLFAVFPAGHADDLHVLDLGVGIEEVLDLLGVDVLAAADDHVLNPPGDAEIAVFIHARHVARMEPAVLVDGEGRRLGHFYSSLS